MVSPPQTTQCGEDLCRDVLVGDIILSPCCVDADRGACGLDLTPLDYIPVEDGCAELRQPGNQDGDCPAMAFDDPVTPMNLPGCCMPNGLCGVTADLLLVGDFGCVDPRDFLTDAMNVPDQLPSCTPMPDEEPDASTGGSEGEQDASVTDPMDVWSRPRRTT